MVFKQGCNSDGEVMSSMYCEHDPVDFTCANDGMTRQEFADECDINVILQTYEKTGVLTHVARGAPQYLDVSNVPDLAGAMAYMFDAEAAFMSLPAMVRKEFDNDPLKFVDFAVDPANIARMREWGLAAPEKPVQAPPAAAPGVAPGGEPGAQPAPAKPA